MEIGKNLIVNSIDLPRENSKRVSSGEILGSLANLSQTTGLKDLFIHHEILLPNHRSSPPHKHSQKEEFVYVIKGAPSAWINGVVYDLFEGNAVGFPAGVEHMIFNKSSLPSELIVISNPLHNSDECTFVKEDPFPFLLGNTDENLRVAQSF